MVVLTQSALKKLSNAVTDAKASPNESDTTRIQGPQVSSWTSLHFINEAMEYRGKFSNVRDLVTGPNGSDLRKRYGAGSCNPWPSFFSN